MTDRHDREQRIPRQDTFDLDIEVDLDAAPAAVWAALTEAAELMNWFPFTAAVEPGPGGSIRLGWDEGIEGTCAITAWEPERHIGTSWPWHHAPEGKEAPVLALDYHLEGRGGRTRLRLIHSGFPAGDDWGDLLDGTSRGWAFELRSLRHYLARHRGTRRRMVLVKTPVGVSAEAGWKRFWSRDGVVAEGAAAPLEEDARLRFVTPTGHELAGRIDLCHPPTDLAMTVEGMGDALLRVNLDRWGGPQDDLALRLHLGTFGMPEPEAAALQASWQRMVDGIFAGTQESFAPGRRGIGRQP